MTNEQREAIELAKGFTKMDFSNPIGWTGYYDTELKELSQAIDTVLSLIKEQSAELLQKNAEIAEKDKIIDLMAEEIANSIINTCPLEDYDFDLDCENRCSDNTKECWKIYFERKAENVES